MRSADFAVARFLSLCPFVCQMAKPIIKIFHHQVATPFFFFRAKPYGNMPMWTTLTGASNAGVTKTAAVAERLCDASCHQIFHYITQGHSN